MKIFNKILLGAGLTSLTGLASAAVDPSILTALADASDDAVAVGAAVTVVLVAIFAIKLVRRAL
jgi:nucleoside recognition membrane protein YjiH